MKSSRGKMLTARTDIVVQESKRSISNRSNREGSSTWASDTYFTRMAYCTLNTWILDGKLLIPSGVSLSGAENDTVMGPHASRTAKKLLEAAQNTAKPCHRLGLATRTVGDNIGMPMFLN